MTCTVEILRSAQKRLGTIDGQDRERIIDAIRALANANKQEHIRHVNALLGLHVPILTTPLELIQEPEEDE